MGREKVGGSEVERDPQCHQYLEQDARRCFCCRLKAGLQLCCVGTGPAPGQRGAEPAAIHGYL